MKPEPQQSSHEVIARLVEQVTFDNKENGICVLRVLARGHSDLMTNVGHAAATVAGEWVNSSGDLMIASSNVRSRATTT